MKAYEIRHYLQKNRTLFAHKKGCVRVMQDLGRGKFLVKTDDGEVFICTARSILRYWYA